MWKTLAPVLTGICLSLAAPAPVADKPKAEDAFVLAIGRFSGGDGSDFYQFTLARDGCWEFKPQGVQPLKGRLSADDLNKWVKEIECGGLYTVKSNPDLWGEDVAFMDITVQTKDSKTRVRIPLQAKLAQAIDKKIVELTQPGK